MQTQPAFNAALKALKDAGAVLVDIDVGELLTIYKEEADAWPFYTYEMPRELARWVLLKVRMCFVVQEQS